MSHGFNPNMAMRHYVNPDSIACLSGADRLAELMAQGCDTQAISDICGYANRQVVNSQIQRLRRRMGWQAV